MTVQALAKLCVLSAAAVALAACGQQRPGASSAGTGASSSSSSAPSSSSGSSASDTSGNDNMASGSASAGASSPKGKAVFEKSCAGCHNAMSPKVTEKDKWAPILKKGENAMVASVMKGKGAMPPRGGAASEEEVRAAVQYLETIVK